MNCCLVLATPDKIYLAQVRSFLKKTNYSLSYLGHDKFDLDNDSRVIVINSEDLEKVNVAQSYEFVLRRLEKEIQSNDGVIPLNEVTVFVNRISPDEKLKATVGTERGNEWENLLAMLILTFPEILWIFCDNSPLPTHSYEALKNPLHEPLFDSTGLRNYVRKQSTQSALPLRTDRAAAIDEESNYALFHAYTAYRFGFLAEPVRSWTLMKHLFGKTSHDYNLLLEDINLSFPDKPENIHLSDLRDLSKEPGEENEKSGRAFHCPSLGYPDRDGPQVPNDDQSKKTDFRIIITSGHQSKENGQQKNEDYLEKNMSGRWAKVSKPEGGMFGLWKNAKLFTRLRHDGVDPGRGQGYKIEPPAKGKGSESHSAPGKLMLIAEHLVRRADNLRNTANTVEECVHGAVLATDALELLRYQTPTLALQALCLKHEFEVRAEVAFLGVGHHFELKMRLKDLEKEVKKVSQFFGEERREAAKLDALISIGNRLMLVFREAGQFDEELVCLAQIRTWHRKLRLKQANGNLDQLAQRVMAYAEWLLISPGRFIAALVAWLLVFWIGYRLTGEPWIDSASLSWNAFIAANPEKAMVRSKLILNAVASGTGLFHLGIFISYLYTTVTRK